MIFDSDEESMMKNFFNRNAISLFKINKKIN